MQLKTFATVAGKKSHKGGGKQFSNPEEIDRQMRAQRELVSEGPEVSAGSLCPHRWAAA